LDHPASSTAVGNQLKNEGPVVCMIKEGSPLMNSIEVGDHIVALDDIDVREMLPIKVSKLMNKRSQHPARKLTMMRNSGVCSIVSP
jgi:PDZ domain-containing secreted protein